MQNTKFGMIKFLVSLPRKVHHCEDSEAMCGFIWLSLSTEPYERLLLCFLLFHFICNCIY